MLSVDLTKLIPKQDSNTRVPPSTAETVNFPLSKDSGAFSSDSAEPHLADYLVSRQEITQFISEIETECKLQKQSEKKDGREKIYIIISSLTSLILGSLILSPFFPDHNNPNRLISIEAGSAAIILTFYLGPIWMWLWPSWKGETYSFDEMRWKCQGIVDQHNRILRSRGLKWNLPCQFPDWIELTKDTKKQNNNLGPTNKHHLIAPTTDSKIIFPAQYFMVNERISGIKNFVFSSDFYSSEMTDDRLSYEEVQDFLSEINGDYRKTVKSFTRQKREVVVLPAYIYMSLLLLVSLILKYYPDLRDLIERETFLSLVLISGGVVSIFSFFRAERVTSKANIQIRAGGQRIVDKYNQTLRNRGLRWYLPEEFPLWIELCKDYSSRIQLIDMPTYNQGSVISAVNSQNHKKIQNEMYVRLLGDEN